MVAQRQRTHNVIQRGGETRGTILRQKQLVELRRLLAQRFSRDDLRTLCFDMGIRYDEFPDSVNGLARELVLYCEQRDSIPELVATAQELRPDISWDTFAPAPTPSLPPTQIASRTGTLASGVWLCPAGSDAATYVGSIHSRKYHALGCRWANDVNPQNRVCFANTQAARAYGYEPCRVCKPAG